MENAQLTKVLEQVYTLAMVVSCLLQKLARCLLPAAIPLPAAPSVGLIVGLALPPLLLLAILVGCGCGRGRGGGKMMKAPGGKGKLIERGTFESNPRAYFKSRRA